MPLACPASGAAVVLFAERTQGAEGVVEVDWTISGSNATLDFQNSTGTAVFKDVRETPPACLHTVLYCIACSSTLYLAFCTDAHILYVYMCYTVYALPCTQGESRANISFNVASDLIPEIDEVFTLTLYNVRTVSSDVASSGHAILSGTGITATITIAASNNAHGVFEFREPMPLVTVAESVPEEVTVVREFGTFGEVAQLPLEMHCKCFTLCMVYTSTHSL